MNDNYVGRHRMPDNENEHTGGMQRIRSLFTRPGYPPVAIEGDYLFTHPTNPLHMRDEKSQ